jgi:alpha-D-xyloside xylohydrolase
LEASFLADPSERVYGLGQHRHGRLNQKGCVVDLEQSNSQIAIPFYLSDRGYAFLWNNPAMGRVELGLNQTRWVADKTRLMDYVVFAGDQPADLLQKLSDAIGYPSLLPYWTTGFWQSRNRYPTQAELMDVAREHLKRGWPLSAIVCDYLHWTSEGDYRFDDASWPDPEAMIRELASMDVKLMVSVWPTVNPESALGETWQDRDLLLRSTTGELMATRFVGAREAAPASLWLIDHSNPHARAFQSERIAAGYPGVTAFWVDACEPEIIGDTSRRASYAMGPGEAVGCMAPLWAVQAIDEMTPDDPERVIVARSAWLGSASRRTVVWSGDIRSTWQSLREQVPAGLNMAVCGIPWWHTDVGGYAGAENQDPDFPELLIRWMQYAVFTPILRLHGHRYPDREGAFMVGGDNELWTYGAEVETVLGAWLHLREALRPYIHQQFALCARTGLPPMRPLFVDFPDDPQCWEIEDTLMFGPDLLVTPVLVPNAQSRALYLPKGSTWTCAWSGESHAGGTWLQVPVDRTRIPVWLREGAHQGLFQAWWSTWQDRLSG